MPDKYKNFFSEIYEHYETTGNRSMRYTFQNPEDKRHFFDC